MRKLIYTFLFLGFLLIGGYFTLLALLKKNGISFESLDVDLPLTIKVKHFTLDKPDFKLAIEYADIALALRPLLSGAFVGDHLLASSATVIIKPSDSPFSYSVVPLINFKDVQLKNVLIKVENETDTFALHFPDLRATKLLWNDSIDVTRLSYKDGLFAFTFNSESKDTITNKDKKISIPDGVPKFKVGSLEILNHDLSIRDHEKLTQINKINLEVNGWNNMGGADLKLKRLDFLIQDTLAVQVNSKGLIVQNFKGASVHDLRVKIPGLDLNVKELAVTETQQGKQIHLQIDRSAISPSLIKLVDRNNTLIRDNAPNIFLEGKVFYYGETLNIDQLTLSTLQKTKLNLYGKVYGVGKQNNFDLKLSPLVVSANELGALININLPKNTSPSDLNCQLAVKGNPNDFNVSGSLRYNSNPFELKAHLHQYKNKGFLGDLKIHSSKFDLKTFAPELGEELVIYELNLNSSLNLGQLSQLNSFDLTLQSDSVLFKNNTIIHPDLNIGIKEDQIDVWVRSPEQNWKLNVTAKGDLFHTKNIHFDGSAHINDLGTLVKGYHTGLLSTKFKGFFSKSRDSLLFQLNLDKVLLTDLNGKENNLQASSLEFKEKRSHYALHLNNEKQEILRAEFNEDLLPWIKNPIKNKDSIPDFYLHSKLVIDSAITELFIGDKLFVNMQNLDLQSISNKLKGNITIPLFAYAGSTVKDFKSTINFSKENKEASLEIGQIINRYLNIDSIQSSLKLSTIDSLTYQLGAKLPSVNKKLDLSGGINILPSLYQIYFTKQNTLRLGEQNWTYMDGNGIFINRETKALSGQLQLTNKEQHLLFYEGSDAVFLRMDSIDLGPIAALFVSDHKVDARLNINAAYRAKQGELSCEGQLNDMALDSISLGITSFSGNITSSKMHFDTHFQSSAWAIDLNAKKVNEDSEIDLKIGQINLSKLDSIFHLVSHEYELSGNLQGDLRVISGKYNSTSGQVKFNKVHIKIKEYGTEANINDQKIEFSEDHIRFTHFILTDALKNELAINGKVAITESGQNSLNILSKKFQVFYNNNPTAVTKGKLDIESDLSIGGSFKNLSVSGNLNLLKGGNVDHYYKSSVSLNGSDDVVTFIQFKEEEEEKLIRRRSIRRFPINWNVNMNIGLTEVYVLLDKTKQNYIKLFAKGELQLKKGKDLMPEVFGNISSTQGKVYYDMPIVSDVEMQILLAKSQWNGDLKNPVLNFKGVETFRVTPNEMSSEFPDKKNRVPVDVTAMINNKTLKNFELDFDISSGNAEVQNMLSALPAETKESYAMNMLLFGKVNSDSKSGTSGMSDIVTKLNEISRRNIKNAELSFHVDNNTSEDANGNREASKIGYNFSKGFLHEKFKVSLGGNFDVGSTPAASKSSPLGTIQLEYMLKEEPNITLQLKRENSYRGPIAGQVDESGIILSYNKRFKNLFRSNQPKKDTSKNKID